MSSIRPGFKRLCNQIKGLVLTCNEHLSTCLTIKEEKFLAKQIVKSAQWSKFKIKIYRKIDSREIINEKQVLSTCVAIKNTVHWLDIFG